MPALRLKHLELDIPEIQGATSEEILRAKIDYVALKTEESFIVDDVSFTTERYGGFPGPYAKFINSTLGHIGWKRLFDDGDEITVTALLGLHYKGNVRIFSGDITGILSFEKETIVNKHAPLNDIIYIEKSQLFLGEALKSMSFKNHRMLALDRMIEFLGDDELLKRRLR